MYYNTETWYFDKYSVDPYQTDPQRVVLSGSALFMFMSAFLHFLQVRTISWF